MGFLKIVLGLVAALALAIGLLFVGARFGDGPLLIIPGGPLEGGDWVAAPVTDWSFAADVAEIELQLEADTTSRTTWVLVHEGQAYLPCNLGFPPFKTWHERADVDGAAIVRIEGKRYPVELRRIDDEALSTALLHVGEGKYGGGPPRDAGVWFFRLDPRAADAAGLR